MKDTSKIVYLFLTTSIGLFFLSCNDKDGDDENHDSLLEVQIYFEYTDKGKDPLQFGIDPADINYLELFAYDEKGFFYEKWIENTLQLTHDYYKVVSLKPGSYTFVAWSGHQWGDYSVNPGDFIPGETDISQNVLSLIRSETNEVTFIPSQLYFAGSGGKLNIKEDGQQVILPLIQDTYTIHVSLDCYEEAGNELQIHVYDDNGSYYLDNSLVADSLHYQQPFVYDGRSSYRGSVGLLRLVENRNPRFVIYDATAGLIRLDIDLINLLEKMYENGLLANIDFNNLYEYTIPLSFCADSSDSKVQLVVDMDTWQVVIGGIMFGE